MQQTDWETITQRRLVSTTSPLENAILATVAYSDIFDYPLHAAEVHRYLIAVAADCDTVDRALANRYHLVDQLTESNGYVMLAGRDEIATIRNTRQADAERLWREALRYGQIIASLPYVRMVAITGELAMDNVQPASDIDYFIVTSPGRLWLCRALTIGVVRLARLRSITVCPNYLLAETALELHEQNLYAAHELTQMVPISGHAIYRRLRAANRWAETFLPNADGPPHQITVQPRLQPLRRFAEWLLAGRIGTRIEHWEMTRKIRKLSATSSSNPEAAYGPDWCKGHVSGHAGRIMAAFNDRRRRLERGLA